MTTTLVLSAVVVQDTVEVTATLEANATPLVGQTVYFDVSGANVVSGSEITDANGEALFVYLLTSSGTDAIMARWGDPDGLDLISSDRNFDEVYRHDGFSGTLLDTLAVPSHPEDITFHEGNLVTITSTQAHLMDGLSATVDTTIGKPSGSGFLVGVTSIDGNLIVCDELSIYECDGFSTTVLTTIAVSAFAPVGWRLLGLGHRWSDLLAIVTLPPNMARIYHLDGVSGTSLGFVTTTSTLTRSAVWNGFDLVQTDDLSTGVGLQGAIYRHDGFTNTIMESFDSPRTQPSGVDWTFSLLVQDDIVVAPAVEEGWGIHV